MRRQLLNDGWTFRPKANRFLELAGMSAEPEPITLPHDAVIGLERTPTATAATGYFPGGVFEYVRAIELAPDDVGSVLVLDFEGVYRDAVVMVNGTVAAERPYGYARFTVPIDHLLQPGVNELKVEARSHLDSRWYSGAGIYRDVWLLQAGPVHLAPLSLAVTTPEVDEEVAVVAVAAVVRNRSRVTSRATIEVDLLDTGGAVVASEGAPVTAFPGDDVPVRLRLHVADPDRWGPDHPHLHTCRVRLLDGADLLDGDETTFGIRSLSLDPKRGLRINGEPVLLRGACVHHDNGPIGAATIARADERRVELLKAAGFNAIRSAHNPMSRAMLDACDRLGMVVMDEAFDMWTQTKTDHDHALRFAEWWERDLEAMVANARNHPSVVFYSVGNEVPDNTQLAGRRRGRELAEKVRDLDPTRYVTQAVSGLMVGGPAVWTDFLADMRASRTTEETGINTTMSNLSLTEMLDKVMQSQVVDDQTAEAFSNLDAAGYNYMDVRFAMDGEAYPNRVVVSTESHPPTIATEWQRVLDNPHVIGEFTWTGWDYIGEAGVGRMEYDDQPSDLPMRGFLGEWPWLLAWCGDLDVTGHRRPQSYLREIVFGLRAEPFLAVLRPEHQGRYVAHRSSWSFPDVVPSWSWPGREGQQVTVHAFADADEVELLLDGTSLGTAAVEQLQAELEVTYQPGELVAVARRAGVEVGRTALRSATGPVVLAATADRIAVDADPRDLAFVALELVDAAGTRWTTADRAVSVEVDGPAVLQGLASADPVSTEAYTGSTCTTFDGRAIAVVRPTGAGTITVTATAEGCPPATVQVVASQKFL